MTIAAPSAGLALSAAPDAALSLSQRDLLSSAQLYAEQICPPAQQWAHINLLASDYWDVRALLPVPISAS